MFFFTSIVHSYAQEILSSPFHFEFERIEEGIYLAYRPEPLRYLVEGNSTIIINEDDVVVVDATGSPHGAKQIIQEIRRLTNKPVTFLVNTHGHGDHTIGNAEFLKAFPNINIVAHPGTREYLTATKGKINYVKDIANNIDSRIDFINTEIEKVKEEGYPGHEAVVANLEQYRDHDLPLRQQTYKNVSIVLPNITFEGKMVLHCEGREIHLLHLGKGDTASDVWVYLPKEKVLISGDANVYPIPYGFSRHGIEWLQTLKKVHQMDFELLIPGHGGVQKDKKYLNLYITLLESVQRQILDGLNAGLGKEKVLKSINISDIEQQFTHGDALLRYYFNSYFKQPYFNRTFDLLHGKLAGSE